MLPALRTKGEGKPLDQVLPLHLPAPAAFAGTAWEDWPEARLREVIVYLRGSTRLQAPDSWREVFPRAI